MLKKLLLAAVFGLPVTAAFAQVPVKIGVLNDRSGVYTDYSGPGSVVAAQLAVEDFKAKEKGLDVQMIFADHQNKPDIGASIARQWFDSDGVDVVLDVPTSSVALAVSQVTREKNKVMVASGPGTSDLTGKQCTPNTVHWTFDTYALAAVTAQAAVKAGGKNWYFITADYAFGKALERDASDIIVKSGGKVLGSTKTPFPNTDFSSALVQAQGSKADVVGLANAGADTVNAVKQANEFGLVEGGQKLAALLADLSVIYSLTPKVAEGLLLTEAFYWDQTDATRAFSERYAKLMNGRKPNSIQAGVYSGLIHYLKAVAALKSAKDGAAVVAKMKEIPIEDPLTGGKGSVRVDGRALHDMYLYEVKKPSESKNPWDLYKVVATVSGEDAFRPLKDSDCPLVKK